MADTDTAEAAAIADLLAAKEAYVADPTDGTAEAKRAAAEELRALRQTVRDGRPTTVGGDAYTTPTDDERF